jgi:hypothetical protein
MTGRLRRKSHGELIVARSAKIFSPSAPRRTLSSASSVDIHHAFPRTSGLKEEASAVVIHDRACHESFLLVIAAQSARFCGTAVLVRDGFTHPNHTQSSSYQHSSAYPPALTPLRTPASGFQLLSSPLRSSRIHPPRPTAELSHSSPDPPHARSLRFPAQPPHHE